MYFFLIYIYLDLIIKNKKMIKIRLIIFEILDCYDL